MHVSLLIFAASVQADDEHDALPGKGASVHGEAVLVTPAAAQAIGLKTAKVTLECWDEEVAANAVVDLGCSHHGYASTLVSGRLTEVAVRPGDPVTAGQELGRVESLELETAQAQMVQAAAELELARRVLAQQENLGDAAPRKDLLTARADARRKAAQLELTVRKLRSVGLSQETIDAVLGGESPVRSLPITSPLAGSVSFVDVRVGQVLKPFDHPFHIVDTSHVLVVGDLLETDGFRVREGMPVRVTLAAAPGISFTGTVQHVGLKVETARRTIPVRVEIPNREGLLRVGMFGRMHLEVAHDPEAILCPSDAVMHRGDEYFVLREQGRGRGKFIRQPVKIDGRSGGRTRILDGLFPAQRVVIVGGQELAALFDAEQADHPGEEPASQPGSSTISAATSARGEIVAQGQIELPTGRKHFASSAVEGRIASLFVERGARVRAGDVLAEIESLVLRNLELDLLQTHIQMDWTASSIERLKDLQGLVAQTPLWQLESQQHTLAGNAQSLSRKLALVGLAPEEIERLEYLDLSQGRRAGEVVTKLAVLAPADGRVAYFELGLGQVVQPGEQLFEIHDLSKVWVQAYVYEQDAERVRVGQKVTVSVAADPTFAVHGTVERISPVLEATGRVMSIWAELDNPELRLKEGMLARVSIAADAPEESVARRAATRPQVTKVLEQER